MLSNLSQSLSLAIYLSLSLSLDCSANPPATYFLNNWLEELQSLKLLNLTLSQDLPLENPMSKFASKAKCRLGIVRCAKSFLGTSEL